MKVKNITTKNSKGQLHGYQERYRSNDKLYYRGTYKNLKHIGYYESHTHATRFFIQ